MADVRGSLVDRVAVCGGLSETEKVLILAALSSIDPRKFFRFMGSASVPAAAALLASRMAAQEGWQR